MVIEDFTSAQRSIIKKICILQLDSLRRLLHNESKDDIDITMLLIENECSQEEYEEQLIKNIEKFSRLIKNPDDLRVLGEGDLSMFRHILANTEKKYKKDFPQAISNLWQRLFLIEKLHNTKAFTFGVN
jgi:succinate dehydrogenase flavin-adding protein (antitoxin of CptAB toxin-antitoxin module)